MDFVEAVVRKVCVVDFEWLGKNGNVMYYARKIYRICVVYVTVL